MMKMRWLSAAVMLTLYTSSSWAFSIDDVAKQAQSLAGKGYETPKSNLSSVFRDMKYADYQQIQFEDPIQTRVLPSGYVLRYPGQNK